MVEKMIKKDHKSHPGVIYAESMLYAVAIKAIYYGINMKNKRERSKNHSSID